MNKQVDKNSKGFKHGFLATVEQYGPEVWDGIRRSLAKDLLEEYLHLAALALLDAGANQDKATNLIAKHWSKEGVLYPEAEDIVREAKAVNEREKKLNANPKTVRKTASPKKPRT
ncbi:hypothetical protein ACS0VJ_09710 [Corynebacterium macclintockiae]|uniref:hypothetical protein n=1 Tax=Corynebacterium macclintockiae TaxID=2913501 RepID=UPI000552335B|nr:hypothetical protein [Corynebacterium macclintockiae]MDK8869338.1 hypothetical protein [Corynebacterium macclintockiae]